MLINDVCGVCDDRLSYLFNVPSAQCAGGLSRQIGDSLATHVLSTTWRLTWF